MRAPLTMVTCQSIDDERDVSGFIKTGAHHFQNVGIETK